jgi:hypothetical protein
MLQRIANISRTMRELLKMLPRVEIKVLELSDVIRSCNSQIIDEDNT